MLEFLQLTGGYHIPETHVLICRMADTLERPEERNARIDVGGPDVLSFHQIALLAAQAARRQEPQVQKLSKLSACQHKMHPFLA